MDLLRDAPPGYDGIAKAFAMARHLPTTHRIDVKIGLVQGNALIATGKLEGYRQVNFFSDHVRELGWQERLLGGEEDMHGCDMVFTHPADSTQPDEDPSFIRRSPVELWPARNVHAER